MKERKRGEGERDKQREREREGDFRCFKTQRRFTAEDVLSERERENESVR